MATKSESIATAPTSRTFAVLLKNDSMTGPDERSIPVGAEVVIDPEIEPKSGHIVLVGDAAGKPWVIAKLERVGEERRLSFLNDSFAPIDFPEGGQILGVGVEWVVRHIMP